MLGHVAQSVGGALPGAQRGLSTVMNAAATMAPRSTGALTFNVPPSEPGDVLIAMIGSVANNQDFGIPSSTWYRPFIGTVDGSHLIAVKKCEVGDPSTFTFSKPSGTAQSSGVLVRLKSPVSFAIGGPRSIFLIPFDMESTDIIVVGVTNGGGYAGGEPLITDFSTNNPHVYAYIFRNVAGDAQSPPGNNPLGPNAGLRCAIRMRSAT